MKETIKRIHEQYDLHLSARQVGIFCSLLLFGGLSIFLAGYFWGHRVALQRFVDKTEEDSFADRINYALYTMHEKDISEFDQNGSLDGEEATDSDEGTKNDDTTVYEQSHKVPLSKIYTALIAGFGTHIAAQQCSYKIAQLGIATFVKRRVSKTKKGQTIPWYQVVARDYDNKVDLEKDLEKIKVHEHIKDMKIVEKQKGLIT